jgi:hypothetical protein
MMTAKQMSIEEHEAEIRKLKAEQNSKQFNSIESIRKSILSRIEPNPEYEGKAATVKDSDDGVRKESYGIDGGLEFLTELVNALIDGSEYKAVKPFPSSKKVNLVKVN